MRLVWIYGALALVGAGCVIGEPDPQVSRFEMSWTLSAGASCADVGAQRVRLQSTLRGDVTPELFADEFACEDGEGVTRPLEPGPYEVQLVALSAADAAVGLSEVRVDIELGPKQTVVLQPFVVEITQ